MVGEVGGRPVPRGLSGSSNHSDDVYYILISKARHATDSFCNNNNNVINKVKNSNCKQ
jgi:hypothetical protein